MYSLSFVDSTKTEFMTRIEYTYLTLYGKPIAPWKTDEGKEYDPKNQLYVHTDIIRFSLKKASMFDEKYETPENVVGFTQQERAVISNIVSNVYNFQFTTYDPNGGSNYTSAVCHLKYNKLLNDCHHASLANPVKVNCMDCANIVSVTAAQQSICLPMTVLTSPAGYKTNEVQIISLNNNHTWAVPFENGFSYHMFNCENETQTGLLGLLIYDACLKIDGGPRPGLAHTVYANKNPRLVVEIPALATLDFIVNVPTNVDYNLNVYRERLVRHNEGASYYAQLIYAGTIDPSMQITDEITENKLNQCVHVTEMQFIGSEYGEYEWKCKFMGSELEICKYSDEDIDQKMKEVLDSFSHRFREEISEDGIEGYHIGINAYVIKKNKVLYRLVGDTALEFALQVL